MTALAEAETVVRRARARLLRAAALDGAARGAVGGALAGLGAAVVARAAGDAPAALVALPAFGAVLGTVWALRRPADLGAAALALDRAAATDEAFVSALTATDAAPWVREFTAARAVARCDARALRTVLAVHAPAAAAAAVVATALLVAVVLVPAAPDDAAGRPPAQVVEVTVPDAGAGTHASPSARTAAMAAAVKSGDVASTAKLAPTVRGDLGAVPDADLRRLAEALSAAGSADAARALAALDRGDRGGAIDALRAALGGSDAGTSAALPGGADPGHAAQAPAAGRLDPWAGASWPLRYDRAVRRYLEEIR